jgi:hypothetical protein
MDCKQVLPEIGVDTRTSPGLGYSGPQQRAEIRALFLAIAVLRAC